MTQSRPEYLDIEIRIFQQIQDNYRTELNIPTLGQYEGQLQEDILSGIRSITSTTIGQYLFESLFPQGGMLRRGWDESRGQNTQRRIRLTLDNKAPELHTIPWELLGETTAEQAPNPLAANADTPFSRYLRGPWAASQTIIERPLKLLVAVAYPDDEDKKFNLNEIDIAQEQRIIEKATADIEPTKLTVTFLEPPISLSRLEERLRTDTYHLLHIVAHGAITRTKKNVILYLADNDNDIRPIKAYELAEMLGRLRHSPQFVYLSSCQTAESSLDDVFCGFAQSLIAAGVSTVLAMQDKIPVKTAQAFTLTFYQQLLAHGAVDLACNEARAKVMTDELPGASFPVLFSRLKNNQLIHWPDATIEIDPPNEITIIGLDNRAQSIKEQADLDIGQPDSAKSPYRGLDFFRPEDSRFFFGRTTVTAQIIQTLQDRHFVAVLGASGSGKSSVVLAGVIPRLNSVGPWQFIYCRPSDDPFQTLAQALFPLYTVEADESNKIIHASDLAKRLQAKALSLTDVIDKIQTNHPDDYKLLVIDQFEEIYRNLTLTHDFLDCLYPIIANPSAIFLIVTMRSDFLGQVLDHHAAFFDVMQGALQRVGPMTPEDLEEAIKSPAEEMGVSYQDGLVNTILNDIGAEPGSLPLLEFALTQLWELQDQGQLTLAAYDKIGRVQGALTHYADQVYLSLSSPEQESARQIFTQLVHTDESNHDIRRLQPKSKIGDENWALVTRLADRRLVVTNQQATDEETVEIVHEALIQKWERLQVWVDADRSFLVWQSNFPRDLKRWQENNQDESDLLSGSALKEAQQWLGRRTETLSPIEQTFINASIAYDQGTQKAKDILTQGAFGQNLSRLNLAKTFLLQADLRQTNLQETNLRGADLRRAYLSETDLRETDFREADLRWADLRGATIDSTTKIADKWRLVWQITMSQAMDQDIQGADLSQANLAQANLSGLNLRQADLHEANLTEANLSQAQLTKANLRGADLSRANLQAAILCQSDLFETDIREADLRWANLREAKIDDSTQLEGKWRLVWQLVTYPVYDHDLRALDLAQANLSGSDLRKSDLQEAMLNETILDKSSLNGINLYRANLHQAKLREATLLGTYLEAADLSQADLTGSDLRDAYLLEANLNGASLNRANLTNADLEGAKLTGADLRGANLHGANLNDTILSAVRYDDNTVWPADFDSAMLQGAD